MIEELEFDEFQFEVVEMLEAATDSRLQDLPAFVRREVESKENYAAFKTPRDLAGYVVELSVERNEPLVGEASTEAVPLPEDDSKRVVVLLERAFGLDSSEFPEFVRETLKFEGLKALSLTPRDYIGYILESSVGAMEPIARRK